MAFGRRRALGLGIELLISHMMHPTLNSLYCLRFTATEGLCEILGEERANSRWVVFYYQQLCGYHTEEQPLICLIDCESNRS
jgi:hypothetical protein